MYRYGASFVGTDISKNQIEEAIRLSQETGMDITYQCSSAEEIEYPENSFDVITACQCFFYFNHDIVPDKLYDLLKPNGKLVILYMAWLPGEDKIAGASEELVRKYNPQWSGAGETRHLQDIPDTYTHCFEIEMNTTYDLQVPFTRETWNGRIRACRGIGASLPEEKVHQFNIEHQNLLQQIAPDEFEIRHYTAMTILKSKK